MNGRQQPGEDAVAGEVAVERGERPPLVPDEVEQAEADEDGKLEGDEVERQRQRDDPLGRLLGDAEHTLRENRMPVIVPFAVILDLVKMPMEICEIQNHDNDASLISYFPQFRN